MNSSESTEGGPWQFSLRTLFVLTGGLAVLTALVANCPMVAGFGGLEFWIALLAPLWLLLLWPPRGTFRQRLRPLLVLVPIGWYLVFMGVALGGWGYSTWRLSLFLTKCFLTCGSLGAIVALVFSARGWRHVVNLPLLFAILAATASIIFR